MEAAAAVESSQKPENGEDNLIQQKLGRVVEIVSIQMGMPGVGPDDRLIEDLGTESADLVNIVATLEEAFDVVLEEETIAQVSTVRDLAIILIRSGHRGPGDAD